MNLALISLWTRHPRVRTISLTEEGKTEIHATILGIAAIVVTLSVPSRPMLSPTKARYAKVRLSEAHGKLLTHRLRARVPGIVESTIYNLVEYKSFFPDRGVFPALVQTPERRLPGAALTQPSRTRQAWRGMYLSYGARLD